MAKRLNKLSISKALVIVALLVVPGKLSLAAINVENPSFSDLAIIINNIITVLIVSVGFLFAAFVAHGAWKAAMSLGDPRGLEGAKQAWTNAVMGAFIVLASMTIFVIIVGFFGIDITPAGLAGKLTEALLSLVTELKTP